MPICFENPDGTHTRGCDRHMGEHPYDWCRNYFEKKLARMDMEELVQLMVQELARLRLEIGFSRR